ncbi:MAG: RNA polymerase subunit sigma-24 [Oscillatoria sp. SIO1A7]|nr:RNA polymerase subunit sigma-24 [Oscillatoria sp. SIO1A7]
MPAPDRTAFVGYQEQLAHLLELLSPWHRAHRISIEGIGGAGKTTLILEAAYRSLAQSQFEAIVFTSAQPHRLAGDRILRRIKRERTLRDIFRTICRTLERPDILAADFEIQFEGIQDLLADRSVLLIVDNLETIEDQEDVCSFLYELPAKVKAVATSRDRAPSDCTIHLESLSAGDAARLIGLQAREKDIQLYPEDCQKLYQKTGGIPGAIVYTIGQLAGGYLLTDVLARLDSNRPGDLTRFCFESSVLPLRASPAHRLLMAAAIFAKPALLEAITYVAATADPDGLAKLQQLSLIKRSKQTSQPNDRPNNHQERYDMLALTRGYVLAEIKAHPEFEAEARSRWVSWYRIFVEKYGGKDETEWQDFSEIEAEWENLGEAIEWCIARERYEDVLYFWQQVKSYSYSRGRQRDRLTYWTVNKQWEDWLLQAAEAREDWPSAVEVMRDRAWKLTLKGREKDLEAADAIFARAWDLRNYRELSAQLDLAICIAGLRIEQKQFEDALDWLNQGDELLKKWQGAGEQGAGEQGAEEQRDFSLHPTPYTPHPSSSPTLESEEVMRFRIRLLHPEGQINYNSGEYDKAKIAFQKVLELAQSISWQRVEFLAKDWLGHIAIKEGDFDLAELLFLKSIDIAREKKDNCRIAFCKRGLARLESERGNPREACKRGREALAEFQNLGMTVEAEETKDMLESFGALA